MKSASKSKKTKTRKITRRQFLGVAGAASAAVLAGAIVLRPYEEDPAVEPKTFGSVEDRIESLIDRMTLVWRINRRRSVTGRTLQGAWGS